MHESERLFITYQVSKSNNISCYKWINWQKVIHEDKYLFWRFSYSNFYRKGTLQLALTHYTHYKIYGNTHIAFRQPGFFPTIESEEKEIWHQTLLLGNQVSRRSLRFAYSTIAYWMCWVWIDENMFRNDDI